MKKMRFLPLVLLLGVMLVACQKDSAHEWEEYYGYSLDQILGTYTFSNVSSAFNSLIESDYCHICRDADISVTSYLDSESSISFKVNCPKAGFNKTFSGRPVENEDGFLVLMSMPNSSVYPDYELKVYVYKNDKGDVRLHGFARRIFYEIVYEHGEAITRVKSMVNYYFDVVKD